MCVFCVRVDELVSVLLVLLLCLYTFYSLYVSMFYMTLLTCVQFLVFCSNSLSFAFEALNFQCCLHCNGCWCLMLGSLQLYI